MRKAAPTLVLTGGQVLTVDGDFTVTEGVAVHGREILATGSDAEMRALAGLGTRLVELGGRTVLPGLNDSHLHGAAYGMTKPPFAIDVGHPAVGSIADIAAAVRQAAAAARPGSGSPVWAGTRATSPNAWPTRAASRTAATWTRPPRTTRCASRTSPRTWCGPTPRPCAGAASTAGATPPPGGVVDRDPDGEPTGILREAAQRLVQAALPAPTIAQRRQAIQGVVRELHARGITSYTEPGLGPGGTGTLFGGLSTDNWTAYAELAAEGELHARVSVLLLPAPMGGSAEDLRKGLEELHRPESADPRLLHAIGVKIFADGVPPNRTAWMNEPYPGGGHGALCVHGDTPALQVAELREMIGIAHRAGFQLGVHVTGDRAIDTVVEAFVAANAAAPAPTPGTTSSTATSSAPAAWRSWPRTATAST